MRARTRALIGGGSLALLAALAPAAGASPPTTSVWGYSGLAIMPTGLVLGEREFSVGAVALTKGPIWRLAPYAAAGVFEGLEIGALYGAPGPGNGAGVSGFAKYQLVRPSAERPVAVALGGSLLGVPGTDRYVEGNGLYLVVSHDLNWKIDGRLHTLASLHGGFLGNLALSARMAGGLEVPIGEAGSLFAEAIGPSSGANPYWNAGASYRFGPGFQVRAYTFGSSAQVGALDRDYALALSYTGRWPAFGASQAARPLAHPTPYMVASVSPPVPLPAPSVATPKPPVAPAAPREPVVQPPAPSARPSAAPSAIPKPANAPEALVSGLVLDDQGRALAGYRVGVVALNRSVRTDARGHYAMRLPQGPHELVVWDAASVRRLARPIRVAGPQGLNVPLVLSLPAGSLKGAVLDAKTRQPVAGATVALKGPEGTAATLTAGLDGTFARAELPLGAYALRVSAPGFEVSELRAEIKGGGDRPLLVALTPLPGVLSGRVTGPGASSGQPVVVRLQGTGLATAADAQGRYRLPEVPPGTHVVQAMRAGALLSQRVVTLGAGQALSVDLTVPTPTPKPTPSPTPKPSPSPKPTPKPSAASPRATAAPARASAALAGRVTDAAGAPLQGVKIVLEGPELTVLTVSDAQGRFGVADVPLGSYRLTATKAGYLTEATPVALTAPGVRPLTLKLRRS